MSILSKLLGGVKKAVQTVAPALSVIPGPVGMIAGGLGLAAGAPSPSRAPGGGGGGLAPASGFMGGIPQMAGTGGLGQMAAGGMGGMMASLGLGGATAGAAQRMKYGKLTGAMIPSGYQEVMDRNGYVRVVKVRRARGISGTDLRRARRVIGTIERFKDYLGTSPARRKRRS